MDCCGVGGCFVCSECSNREGRQKGGWRICALDHQHSLSLVGLHLFCIQPILLVVAASDPLKADVDTTLISTKQISLTLSEVTSFHAKSGLLASVPSGTRLWLLSSLFTEFLFTVVSLQYWDQYHFIPVPSMSPLNISFLSSGLS